MASVRELKKRIKKTEFINRMKSLGFEFAPDWFWFYRLREKYIDELAIQPIANGNAFRVHISTWSEEVLESYDMSQFPKKFVDATFNLSGKHVTPGGVSWSHKAWKSRSDEELEDTLECLLTVITDSALPRFDVIVDRGSHYLSIQ